MDVTTLNALFAKLEFAGLLRNFDLVQMDVNAMRMELNAIQNVQTAIKFV